MLSNNENLFVSINLNKRISRSKWHFFNLFLVSKILYNLDALYVTTSSSLRVCLYVCMSQSQGIFVDKYIDSPILYQPCWFLLTGFCYFFDWAYKIEIKKWNNFVQDTFKEVPNLCSIFMWLEYLYITKNKSST